MCQATPSHAQLQQAVDTATRNARKLLQLRKAQAVNPGGFHADKERTQAKNNEKHIQYTKLPKLQYQLRLGKDRQSSVAHQDILHEWQIFAVFQHHQTGAETSLSVGASLCNLLIEHASFISFITCTTSTETEHN